MHCLGAAHGAVLRNGPCACPHRRGWLRDCARRGFGSDPVSALLRGAVDVPAPTHLIALLALGLLAQPARFPLLPLLALAAGLLAGALAIAFGIGETPAASV